MYDKSLATDVKIFVRAKYAEGVTKPNQLLERIRQQKLPVPLKSKLESFLQSLRIRKLGKATISAEELRTLCVGRRTIPADEDEAFVVEFDIFADSPKVADQRLRVVLSTRRLLALCKKSPMLQCDATYKLVWQGYSVLLARTTDRDRVFHPFALAITKGETTEDFQFSIEF